MTAEMLGTIRLGVKLSVGAVALAIVLSLIGDVSPWAYVTAVAIVGSVLSWNQSARDELCQAQFVTRETQR